ncbi:MAG: DUF2007 domain-containing protein [Bacteroidota bacterium]
MENGWVNVYASGQPHLVEMAKALLLQNQIESVIVDKRDSLYITLGEMELFVRDYDVMKAKFILEKNTL